MIHDATDYPRDPEIALAVAEDLLDRCCDELRQAWNARRCTAYARRRNVVRAFLAWQMARGAAAQARRAAQMAEASA